jgi:NAD(P)-dependent dehydrogenase (short-subunit alcohol dehydrogenase family)
MTQDSGDWLGLRGKICVVTGAGGGIGRAVALGLAGAGAQVVLMDRQTENLGATAEAVTGAGGDPCLTLSCDVSDPASVAEAARRSEAAVGPCDVLVNNAGLLRPGALETMELAEWNALLSVNLSGYFLCAQAFGRQMRAHGGGAIVHVASIAGSHPQGFSGAYSVSKAGVVMLSRQIATEWGAAGIRSNVVSPGMVETPMSEAFYAAPGVRERRSAVVPRGRIGQPQDIADAILFLASKRADYVNGDEITVDGGYTRMIMSLVPRPGHTTS